MDILKDTIITGANGMVGSYIDFGIKLGHEELDITNPASVERAFAQYRPKAVVHLAAETDVDRCEREPAHAYFVNGVGTWNIAQAAKKHGAKMIYISTVYVFDGSKGAAYDENDAPTPPNTYGRSKHLGEIAIRGLLEDYAILRPGWMFGGGPSRDKKFIPKIMKQMGQEEIKAVSDTVGCLTYAKDLAAKIKEVLADSESAKTIHVFNEGFASRYDIAAEMVKLTGSAAKVTAVDSSYFNLDASRSHSDKMISLYGGAMRPWAEALADYLKNEWTGQV